MEVENTRQRKRMITSTPAAHGTFNSFEQADQSPIKTDEQAKKVKINEKLVAEAVTAMSTKGKGASYQSIQKYIRARNDAPDMDLPRVKVSLKKTIMKCIENGTLKRPKRNESSMGVTGHFMLAKDKPKKANKENEKPSKDNSKTSKPEKSTKEKKLAESKEASSKQKKPLKVEAKKETKSKEAKKETKSKEAKKETKTKETKPTEAKKETKAKKETGKEKLPKKTKKEEKEEKNSQLEAEEIAQNLDFSDSEAEEKTSKATKANVKKAKEPKSKTNVNENFQFSGSESEEKAHVEAKPEKTNAKKQKTKEKPPSTKPNKANKNAGKDEEEITDEAIAPEEKSKTELDSQATKAANKVPKVPQNKKGAKPDMKMKRKDLSDTELNVTHHMPMPLKSYSSDTELEVSRKIEAKNKKAARGKGDPNLKSRNNSQLKKESSSILPNQMKSKRKQ